MKRIVLVGFLGLVFMSQGFAAERSFPSIGVGITGGTLGVGLTVTVPVLSVLNARFVGSGLGFDIDVDIDDSDGIDNNELAFEGDITLGASGAVLDYHPFRNGFRASAGLLYTFNNFDGTAVCDQIVCEFGGQPAVVGQGDRLRGEVDYSGVAPYIGMGWGDAIDKAGRWSFSADLGAMFTGSPNVSVRCTQVSTGGAALGLCDRQAEQEEDALEDEVGDFDVYPVVSIGFAYRF